MRLRAAVTLEQCWHEVPGGTASSALETTKALQKRDDIEVLGVAARHDTLPPAPWTPTVQHLPTVLAAARAVRVVARTAVAASAIGDRADRRDPRHDIRDPAEERAACGDRARPRVPARALAFHQARSPFLQARTRACAHAGRSRARAVAVDARRLRRRRLRPSATATRAARRRGARRSAPSRSRPS